VLETKELKTISRCSSFVAVQLLLDYATKGCCCLFNCVESLFCFITCLSLCYDYV